MTIVPSGSAPKQSDEICLRGLQIQTLTRTSESGHVAY
jgi:hypothetical protein